MSPGNIWPGRCPIEFSQTIGDARQASIAPATWSSDQTGWQPGIMGSPVKMTARRGQVLSSVAASFAAKGYHGIGMREIAQSLGLNQGTLYHYFASKDAALAAVCLVGQERTLADLQHSVTSLSGFAERVRMLFKLHLDSLDECGDFLHVYVDLRGHVPYDLAEPLRSGWRDYRRLLSRMFDAAALRGELPAHLDLRHASRMLTAIHRSLNSLHRTLPMDELERFTATACDIYLTGVLPRAA